MTDPQLCPLPVLIAPGGVVLTVLNIRIPVCKAEPGTMAGVKL